MVRSKEEKPIKRFSVHKRVFSSLTNAAFPNLRNVDFIIYTIAAINFIIKHFFLIDNLMFNFDSTLSDPSLADLSAQTNKKLHNHKNQHQKLDFRISFDNL